MALTIERGLGFCQNLNLLTTQEGRNGPFGYFAFRYYYLEID